MLAFVAKKLCPELIVLKSHYEWYNEMSNKVMSIFRRYDPTMCAAGCDEGYLKCVVLCSCLVTTFTDRSDISITNYCEEHSLSPEECVSQMRSVVQEETMLTVSAGIAPNKVRSRRASSW